VAILAQNIDLSNDQSMIIGIDEVGRGALAGPAVVGAVESGNLEALIPELLAAARLRQLRDSKKLTLLQREAAFTFLSDKILWGVGEASPREIDELGLTAALRLAAGRAMEKLARPERILADAGLRHPFEADIPTEWFVKGDETQLPITLASIMAKVWRDRLMVNLAATYPGYGFERHVGYGTGAHLAALRSLGPADVHRRSFIRNLVP